MLWGRDFNDPAFIAQWKEHLKSKDREWIEPCADCKLLYLILRVAIVLNSTSLALNH